MKESSLIKTIPPMNQLKQQIDPDNTQILLKSLFLNHFFPIDHSNEQLNTPFNGKPFLIYHYNGLPRSNQEKKVRYASAQAQISDYGYGNDTPNSAVAPVQPGFLFFFLSENHRMIVSFFQRNLFTNHRCLKNKMANN